MENGGGIGGGGGGGGYYRYGGGGGGGSYTGYYQGGGRGDYPNRTSKSMMKSGSGSGGKSMMKSGSGKLLSCCHLDYANKPMNGSPASLQSFQNSMIGSYSGNGGDDYTRNGGDGYSGYYGDAGGGGGDDYTRYEGSPSRSKAMMTSGSGSGSKAMMRSGKFLVTNQHFWNSRTRHEQRMSSRTKKTHVNLSVPVQSGYGGGDRGGRQEGRFNYNFYDYDYYRSYNGTISNFHKKVLISARTIPTTNAIVSQRCSLSLFDCCCSFPPFVQEPSRKKKKKATICTLHCTLNQDFMLEFVLVPLLGSCLKAVVY
jgi:hypothetical protein